MTRPPADNQLEKGFPTITVAGYKPVIFRSDFRLYYEGQSYLEEEGEKVYCAKLAESALSGIHYWLVLKCIDVKQQVYERIGLVNNSGAKWISNNEGKKSIKVV